MLAKPKLCAHCNEIKPIWKNDRGTRYCKTCWSLVKPTSTTTLTKRTPIKQVSDKQSKLNVVYAIARKEFLSRSGNKCCRARLVPECSGCSEELTIHHAKGRGKYLLDTTTWKALCIHCHMYVETHPEEAKALGYSETRI
jgi:formamidopyrimidine-DNA glycosylase